MLAELLHIRPGITAVAGSGGKTTLLRTLGEELRAGGGTVVLCTTTKIYPFAELENLENPDEPQLRAALAALGLVCAGKTAAAGGKLTAPDLPMARLAAVADYVLVEADGSAQRPLKAHAPYEPVIPPETGQTVWVAGLSGLGRPIAEAAHRPELYAALAGVDQETLVTPALAARVLLAESSGGVFLLNQADSPPRLAAGRALAALLGPGTVLGSLKKGGYEVCW